MALILNGYSFQHTRYPFCMKTDTLGRRKRTESIPSEGMLRMTDGASGVLRALRRHPVLPTPLLYPFWRGDKKGDYTHFQKEMAKLFCADRVLGSDLRGKLVDKPPALNPDFGPQYEPNWYELTPAGRALSEGPVVLPTPRDHEFHRAMGSSIDASFEITAPQHGLEYLHLEDILIHPKCPPATRAATNPLLIQTTLGKLEPDGLFALRHPGLEGKPVHRFYAREDDRSTESFHRSQGGQNSLQDKIDKYLAVFANRTYWHHFGIINMDVLFCVTQPGRIQTCLDYLRDKPFGDRFLFKVFPSFGVRRWRAPRAPVEDVYTPWTTVTGAKDLTQP
jgi:hypothetical protein